MDVLTLSRSIRRDVRAIPDPFWLPKLPNFPVICKTSLLTRILSTLQPISMVLILILNHGTRWFFAVETGKTVKANKPSSNQVKNDSEQFIFKLLT